MISHKVHETDSSLDEIELTEGEYSGVKFKYGKINFVEKDEKELAIEFEYDILDACGKEIDLDAFEKYIGDFLVQLIEYGLSQNSLSYTGGRE